MSHYLSKSEFKIARTCPTKLYYKKLGFPSIQGKLSLKAVLPAVWESNLRLHTHPTFSQYFQRNSAGYVDDPYLTLPPLPFSNNVGEYDEVVTEGSGAMRHTRRCFMDSLGMKEKWKTLLLQYCELDTAAMVIVWLYWEAALAGRRSSLEKTNNDTP